MSFQPINTDQRKSRFNRLTIWPSVYGEDIELSAPWPGRYMIEPPNKRWTNAYDAEARASRMSFLVGDGLLPGPPQDRRIWPGQIGQNRTTWRGGNRTTWIDEVHQQDAQVWDGQFDVEKRASFLTRSPNRWSDGFEIGEKEKERYREPLTQAQIAQADSALPFLVRWMENDPANPLMFPVAKKWINAMILAFAVFMVSVAASGFSQGTTDIKSEFNVGQTAALLITSVYVLGFAVGALVLSPLSEVYGRRDLYVWTFLGFVVFTGAISLAQSVTVILLFRFLGGLAGSFTQAVAPAVIADIFTAQERGFVLSIFTLAGLMGQMMGPITCGFLDAAFGWRSLPVLIIGASFPIWVALTFTFPETYAPTLLKRRAEKLTAITGKLHIVDGMQEAKTIATQLRVGALRPWVILIYEPIVTLLSLFLSVVQGTLFLLFAAYPIVFQQVRGWPQGVASLPFLAIALGIVLSLVYVAAVDQQRYAKVVEKNNGFAPPEARLPPAMLGSVALPIGLFWFAWTNDPSVYWLVSVSAGVFFGFGMVLLYMSLTNYLVDAYLGYAASALAASTVLRSIAGAVFPLFTNSMYDSLGIHWASSVPGFLSVLFIPSLIAFYKYGHIIRSKTRFGQEAAKIAAVMEGK
ncbi:major facilitator superfamily domain-containing protein [Pseudomassariella vexata]|uniref:Major facilitator superfamily domain-containing protein n=1 Tax=Pseudomassariella vexata TaxID=1141098 RepID=A0A1Y2DM51_9PEZI|nr:major facilitator superfamily domain-containing protein [Pseudomassariella vexata]ORY60219.1 major facilitator superfamily domain-containing protein [Pseudomassariella vexata]